MSFSMNWRNFMFFSLNWYDFMFFPKNSCDFMVGLFSKIMGKYDYLLCALV